MSVTDQEKFPLFSTDVGSRIAFLREKQGLTLQQVGEGRASTAQSWEKGKMPRRDKWSGIAERLQLSELFIFHGRPETNADYAFVEKWRNDIAGADAVLEELENLPGGTSYTPKRHFRQSAVVEESRATYGAPLSASDLRDEIFHLLAASIEAAGNDVGKLGWIREQLRRAIEPPLHWATEEDNAAVALAKKIGDQKAFMKAAEILGKAPDNPQQAKAD